MPPRQSPKIPSLHFGKQLSEQGIINLDLDEPIKDSYSHRVDNVRRKSKAPLPRLAREARVLNQLANDDMSENDIEEEIKLLKNKKGIEEDQIIAHLRDKFTT